MVKMRTDYILYTVAVIFFVITAIVAAYQVENQQLWIVSTAVLGFFFIGLGYIERTRMQTQPIRAPPPATIQMPAPPEPVQPISVEATRQEVTTAIVEVPKPALDITQVKGVKAKRAEQLKALGISTVDDLASASAEDLGTKLKISPKITEKWVADAKALLEKAKH
jgi:predicted flap endonuclease-1-like 5' DNA nuclease